MWVTEAGTFCANDATCRVCCAEEQLDCWLVARANCLHFHGT